MDEREFIQKITYHKRMLGNLKKYLTVGIVFSGISVLILRTTSFPILGWIIFVVSVIWTVLVGYAIYNGNRKANQLIDSFEKEYMK